MSGTPRHPALDRVAAVAAALGELNHRVVFIGGAIAPLLQTQPSFPGPRPTSDVDAMVATTWYSEAQRVHEALAARGFRRAPEAAHHAHRWIGPHGIPFDLVPAGQHPGASGNPWDEVAIATAVEATLDPGLSIRHASAPGFLALKWSAYRDRGRGDPLNSHDLEDILALLASRPSIVGEIAAAPPELRSYLVAQATAFLAHPHAADLLAAHINNAQNPARTSAAVRALLERMSTLSP